jgi:hypothetical protein
VTQGCSRKRATVMMTVVLLALGALTAGTAMADTSTVAGQWRFDEGGGQTAVDDGPFALDGRLGLTDAADDRDPSRIAGLSGDALRFDDRSFVRLPNAAPLEPGTLTLEAVVRAPSSPGRFRYVVAHGAEGCIAGSYGLYTGADGGMAFYVFDGTGYRVSPAIGQGEVWNGDWHHVAGVFDGRRVRLYVDGHPVGDPADAPLTIAYALTSSDTYFGIYQGSCALPLRGDVDLVRLWHGPLAPDTVAALSDQALAGAAAPSAPGTPAPGSVPVTTAEGSNSDAPASRTTLTPVSGGGSLPVNLPSGADKPSSGNAPGAPARACVVRPSSTRLRVGRRTDLTVRVALRGKPLKAVRVTATEGKSRRRLATARTAKDGRARLRVRPRRRGTVKLVVVGRTDCGAAALTVLKPLGK